jgi:hypothetical protein
MLSMFHRRFLMALLVSLAFAAFPLFTYASHSWNNYHWARTSNPFTLQLGDNVGDKDQLSLWAGYLTRASDHWSNSPGGFAHVLNTVVGAGNNLSNLRKCPPTSGRVEVCSYRYGTNGWLGVAQIWLTNGHIYQGTVKLNDSYFNNSRYPKYNSAPWRNLVICQEVGHTFGLDHQDETFGNTNLGTCMDYTNDPDGTLANPDQLDNEYPNDHDYEELAIIYNHTNDDTTTVGQTVQIGRGKGKTPPPANDEPVELGTAQWGKLIRSTNHGRTELYELDLGRGHKILTHVIWAEPEEEAGPQRGRR